MGSLFLLQGIFPAQGSNPGFPHYRWILEPPIPRIAILGFPEDLLEKGMQPTPILLPGKAHGQRGLAGYSPRGHKESDRAELLITHTKIYRVICM